MKEEVKIYVTGVSLTMLCTYAESLLAMGWEVKLCTSTDLIGLDGCDALFITEDCRKAEIDRDYFSSKFPGRPIFRSLGEAYRFISKKEEEQLYLFSEPGPFTKFREQRNV